PFTAIQKGLDTLEAAVNQQLGQTAPGPAVLEQITSCRADLETVIEDLQKVLQGLTTNELKVADVFVLAIGFQKTASRISSDTEDMNDDIQDLADIENLPASGAVADGIKTLNSLSQQAETVRKK